MQTAQELGGLVLSQADEAKVNMSQSRWESYGVPALCTIIAQSSSSSLAEFWDVWRDGVLPLLRGEVTGRATNKRVQMYANYIRKLVQVKSAKQRGSPQASRLRKRLVEHLVKEANKVILQEEIGEADRDIISRSVNGQIETRIPRLSTEFLSLYANDVLLLEELVRPILEIVSCAQVAWRIAHHKTRTPVIVVRVFDDCASIVQNMLSAMKFVCERSTSVHQPPALKCAVADAEHWPLFVLN
jgi:hypothetical protein